MFEKIFKWAHRPSRRQLERDEIRASSEDAVWEMKKKGEALDRVIIARMKLHIEGKTQ